MNAWKNAGFEVDQVKQITAEELNKLKDPMIIDVRRISEYQSEHVEGAENYPLIEINDHLSSLPKGGTFYVHCASGYRSLIASSILKSRGFHNLVDVDGGFDAIKETNMKVSDYVCPSTF